MPENQPIGGSFQELLSRADPSLVRTLVADPEQATHQPNKTSRPVRRGHYVQVQPTKLPNPSLIAHSRLLLQELGVTRSSDAQSDDFLKFFSGDMSAAQPALGTAFGWATPYALSIYGQEMTANCPFRTGDGYGDGRAISVLEVLLPTTGKRWELQLKGGGTTPFCRGGDGRAVLRSSLREFLASEAMHNLGVPTCRTLCVAVSQSETVPRMWYSEGSDSVDPDRMEQEAVAIATRVAPSLLRVGQLELFGRRARSSAAAAAKEAPPSVPLADLQLIVAHAIQREYPEIAAASFPSFEARVVAFVGAFGKRLASLTAEWIRVGYCQGNFNSDNCAIGGRVLDYGPFGFMEKFSSSYQMWIGGGEHFSFMNQPMAGAMNFKCLCTAVVPLVQGNPEQLAALKAQLQQYPDVINTAMNAVFARKLGLLAVPSTVTLTQTLLELMDTSSVDYTLFFRELSSTLPRDVAALHTAGVFYADSTVLASGALTAQWNAWLDQWHTRLRDVGRPLQAIQQEMLLANPKFIPREWMLVEAYNKAKRHKDFSSVHALHTLFETPYAEHSDEPAVVAKYYRRAPEASLDEGGVSRMS